MTWSQDIQSRLQRGEAELEIPVGALVHCVVSYAGKAQHQGFISDWSFLENPQRAAFEAFDLGFKQLRVIIERAGNLGNDGRDLEMAVTWILAMLGFRVLHMGGLKRTQDGVDLIAATPLNHIALVECTTGVLAPEKVSKLLARAELVSGKVKATLRDRKILPVLLTTRSRAEVQGDAEIAMRRGVYVLCREDLDGWERETRSIVDGDTVFSRALQAVEAAVAAAGSGAEPLGFR